VAVSSSAESVARRVMELVGRGELADEPWFSTGAGRAEHADEIDAAMSEWIGARDLHAVIEAFAAADVALAPVYDVSQYMEDPQVRARGAVAMVEDKTLGPVAMQNVLFKLSETPGAIRHTGRELGADTDAILHDELGYADDELATLRANGVIA